jgi:diketogulonate reductase-like aldo/keto reductase
MNGRDGRSAASRRDVMKALGFGLAGAALLPHGRDLWIGRAHAQARPASGLLMRSIPRTGESIPAVGMGSFLTFDVLPGHPRDHLREVLQRFWRGGGRVIDTSPLYGTAEVNVGDFATALGINDRLFVTNKIWSTGEFLADDSHAQRSLEASAQRLWRRQIDVMQVHSLVNVDFLLPLLKAWKKEGHVRYVGVTHHEPAYFGLLADWIERGDLDFVQVHYSIHTRAAEERVLRAAAARGTAVLVNMPFEKARLFKVVGRRPVPDFARDAGIRNWAQFFLKWILANPAVTCVLPATANPAHAAENIGALRGPLPDRDLRARMAQHMTTIPGFDKLADMPWYPDKRYPGMIGRAQAELRQRS